MNTPIKIKENYFKEMIKKSLLLSNLLIFFIGCFNDPVTNKTPDPVKPYMPAPSNYKWACSEDHNIVVYSTNGQRQVLTTSNNDFKPSWSKTDSMITFFRAIAYGSDFKDWRTKICVIKSDGSGFRELTAGNYPDFNPTWTRNGSNKIIFNRYSPQGGWHNKVYWILSTGSPGSEQLISDPDYPDYEWMTSTLKDGRIIVDRINDTSAKSYFLTPNPGAKGTYEEIERPTNLLWHKLNVSPDETMVTYMLDHDGNTGTYQDVTICYASLDVGARRIYNQIEITNYDLSQISEYPCWNQNESKIFYDSNRSGIYQIYAYDLTDQTTTNISPFSDRNFQFIDIEGMPK